MKTLTSIFILCLFFCHQGLAQTLIIADVDDTLKISHTQSTVDSVENAFHLENQFLGMSLLLNSLRGSQPLQFFYVSNALDYIQSLHENFLSIHRFPAGPVLLRQDYGDQEHKFRTISQIIQKTHPTHVVMIGDNSESDTIIYAKVQHQFPQIKMSIFIHQLYSALSFFEAGKHLLPGEIAYVTSVDLAAQFKKLELLSEKSYQSLAQTLVPKILAQPEDLYFGEIAFPAWMDCLDFSTKNLDLSTELLKQYAQKVRVRCANQPLWKIF